MPAPTSPFPNVAYVERRRVAENARARATENADHPVTYGIALSGGGARSLSCSSGLLRGLKSVGILDTASHITGVSGGGWATSIYSFAQGFTQEEILIQSRAGGSPADLTVEFLKTKPPASSMLHTATNTSLVQVFTSWARYLATVCFGLMHPDAALTTPASRMWVNTIYTTFFKPMGIPYGKNLAPSAAHVERIVAKKPELYRASDFLVPAPYARHIPSLGITLVGPPSSCFGFSGSARSPWGLTLPFYKAAIVANNETYQQLELAKSGDVSAAAARAREQQHGVSLVSYVITPSEVFTRYVGPPMQISKIDGAGCLAGSTPDLKVMPTSVPPHDFVVGERSALCGSCACCNGKAAFPLEVVAAMGGLPVIENYTGNASVLNTFLTRTTPSLKYRTSPGEEAPRRLMLADGGLRENTGIVALLLQGVTDILSAVNTYQPFLRELADTDPANAVIIDLSSLFGVDLANVSHFSAYAQNAIFPLDQFHEMIRQFCAAHDTGRTLIANLHTKTVENTFHGVPAGLDVRVAIIHSYAPPSFTSQLPADVAALPSLQPYNTRGTLPYFLTTFANPPEPFRMSNVQANLLDALQCWVIETEARQGGALHDFVERQRRGTAL